MHFSDPRPAASTRQRPVRAAVRCGRPTNCSRMSLRNMSARTCGNAYAYAQRCHAYRNAAAASSVGIGSASTLKSPTASPFPAVVSCRVLVIAPMAYPLKLLPSCLSRSAFHPGTTEIPVSPAGAENLIHSGHSHLISNGGVAGSGADPVGCITAVVYVERWATTGCAVSTGVPRRVQHPSPCCGCCRGAIAIRTPRSSRCGTRSWFSNGSCTAIGSGSPGRTGRGWPSCYARYRATCCVTCGYW